MAKKGSESFTGLSRVKQWESDLRVKIRFQDFDFTVASPSSTPLSRRKYTQYPNTSFNWTRKLNKNFSIQNSPHLASSFSYYAPSQLINYVQIHDDTAFTSNENFIQRYECSLDVSQVDLFSMIFYTAARFSLSSFV